MLIANTLEAHLISMKVINLPPTIFHNVGMLILDQYILSDNRWVGQIEEVTQDVTIRLINNTLVKVEKPDHLSLATSEGSAIVDHSLFLSDKFVVGQHVVTHKHNLRRGRWILGEYDPDIEPHGIVVDVRTKMLSVNWVAQRYQAPGNSPTASILSAADRPLPAVSLSSRSPRESSPWQGGLWTRRQRTGRRGMGRIDQPLSPEM